MIDSLARRSAVAGLYVVLLLTLAGCPGVSPPPSGEFDGADLFAEDPDGPDTIARTFECLQRDLDGNCVANQCKEGPGGETFDCRTFASACIDAGLHWDGTRQQGVCAVAL